MLPAVIHVLVGFCDAVGKAVGRHVLSDFRHQVPAFFIVDLVPPAEVVEAVVPHLHFLAGFQADHAGHLFFQVDGHVADVQDLGVRAQTAGGFRHDGRGVGVVEHPGIGGIFFHVVQDFQNTADGAHAVGDAAGAAGFLAQHAVFKRNLFILFPHGVLADADMGEDEVDAGEGCFGIGGVGKFHFRRVFPEVNLTGLGDDGLAFGVVVVEGDLADREAVHFFQKHEGDARCEGAAAACDGYCEFILTHCMFLLKFYLVYFLKKLFKSLPDLRD